jgi:hypothetical protein
MRACETQLAAATPLLRDFEPNDAVARIMRCVRIHWAEWALRAACY